MLNTLSAISLAVLFQSKSFSDTALSNKILNDKRLGLQSEMQIGNKSSYIEKKSRIFLTKNEQEIVLDVPFVHQKNDLKNTAYSWAGGSACGPASLTMAIKVYDKTANLVNTIDKLPSDVYVKGKMFYNLTLGPKYLGYKTTQIENSPQNIYKTLKLGHPILLNIQNYDGITGHEIVVVGIKNFNKDTNTAKSLIVHDPFKRAYREFEYIDNSTLKQPEGYTLPIGTLKPFYITK